MDRLQTITVTVFLTAALVACGNKDSSATSAQASPSADRVNAVASEKEVISLDAFCDVRAPAAASKAFQLPPLAEASSRAFKGWRWTNVWATWCEPCIEEMPRLIEWETKLKQQGKQVELEFLSVDTSAETVAKFRAGHPQIPSGVRIADFEHLAPWLTSLGLDAGATIPIHVMTNPSGRVRCVRTGAINEADYPAIRELLAQG